jgi:hypothetical protein
MAIALLPNREKVLTLFDSGASDSLVCASFVQQSKYLSKLPKIMIPIQKFKVGNGEYVSSRYALEIPIQLQNQKFIVKALALDTLGGIDLVIGTPALREIDACLEFRNHRLRFKHTTFVAYLTRTLTLQPNQVKIVNVSARLPAFLRNASLFVRTSRFISNFTASNMLLKFHNGFASLVLSNPMDCPVTFSHNKPFGIVDLKHLTQIYTPVYATAISEQATQFFCFSAVSMSDNVSTQSQHLHSMSSSPVSPTCIDRQELHKTKSEKFPFLDNSDPRLKMTDKEIIDRDITFHKSTLDPDQQKLVKQLLLQYKDSLSLHSEIGTTDLTIDFDLTDDTPFYIRPFTVSPSEKPIIDKELRKLIQMGVLKEEHTSYSSPVMLLKKKGSKEHRVVTDFRLINTRVRPLNMPFPLIREAIQTIGEAQPTILSVLDLKQAYHCLKLSPKCQDYCGITSYFGGKSYKYLRLPMGLSVSPAVFQKHINTILDSCQARKFCIGIMDDLIIFSKSVKSHFEHLETILKALQRNGLKISPSKAKLFRTKVVYMGHEIMVNKDKQGIRPLRDRTAAIRNLAPPKTKRQLRGFIGKVNYLSMYLPRLQLLLQPLYKLVAKKAEFMWTEQHQATYNSILQLLVKPPILSLPRNHGLFRLYVDTSRVGTGASLWQIQDGQERLLAYFSKALPKAAIHYGISELELTGITIAVSAFRHLLKNTVFEVYTDHASIPQIMRSKAEPSTDRIKRLLERLSGYAIKIGFKKGSEMVISDFLSRNPLCDDDNQFDDIAFPLVTRGEARDRGIVVPTVQETISRQTSKQAFKQPVAAPPAVQPATPAVQPAPPAVQPAPPAVKAAPSVVQPAPPAVQPVPMPPVAQDPMPIPIANLPNTPGRHSLVNPNWQPTTQNLAVDTSQVTEAHSQPPDNILRKPAPLQLQTDEVLTKHLPKQADIDKLLKKITQSRIQDLHLPRNRRELAQMQSSCPNFKDLYGYILEGILPSPKTAAKRILVQSEQYIMIDKILFKLPSENDTDLRLVIPQVMVPEILFLYHDSLLAAHQGIARVTATIRQKFYFPRMSQLVLNYIRSCRICQSRKTPVDQERPFHLNIPTNYVPFQTVHADLKVMPQSNSNHRYLLVLVCNITRYVILVPLVSKEAHTVAEAVLQKCVFQFGPFKEFISDLGKEWDNSVISYVFQALQVNQRFVSVHNHQSNKSERFIGTVSSLLTSYLTNNGRNWPLYVQSVAYAYNSFASPALGNHSPFYLVYLRHPPTVFSCPPMMTVTSGYHDYVTVLKSRLESISKIMLDIQAKLQHEQAAKQLNKVKNPPDYTPGKLVYLLAPTSSSLQIASRKLRLDYVGPFIVKELLDRSHVLLKTLDNKQLPTVIHVSRLKPAWIRSGAKVVNHINDLPAGSKTFLAMQQDHVSTNHVGLHPNSYDILRCRYKHGTLQALISTNHLVQHNLWLPLDHFAANKVIGADILNSKIRIVGSTTKFVDSLAC